MPPVEINPDIFWIGVNDRTTDLFEGMWPITQEGVSYNSYCINDSKKAVIDLAKAFKTDDFFSQIREIINLSELDYVIINHMEPDHTGVLRILRDIAPDITFIGTKKAKAMLKDFYLIQENFMEVSDGDTLSLGKHKLTFFATPFVHWPETMMTYDTSTNTLFSCDGFGGYGALRGSVFDSEYTDLDFYEQEAFRYYANIVAKFNTPVLNAIKKLSDIEIDTIAPSHGLIWQARPERIVNLYKKWAEYGKGRDEKGVTMVYGSMYGNTEAAMNAVLQGVSSSSSGLHAEVFDASRTHVSYILPSLFKYKGVIIGGPTYEGGLFPPVADALAMAGRKGIKGKKAAVFGSYGWSGGGMKECRKILEGLKWEITDELEFPGSPKTETLHTAEKLGGEFCKSICKDTRE